jgi:hypothetical protein
MLTLTDEDTDVRYLEEITYERVPGGWRVPELERDRWDNPPRHAPPRAPGQQPRPVQQLVVELEAWLDVDDRIEKQLRAVYELEPLRVTRAAAAVCAGAESGRLTSPAGLLVNRLREIASEANTPDA